MEMIKLKAKDGDIVTVKRNLLQHSSVLERKLEEQLEAADMVEVPEADGNSLRKILQWIEQSKKIVQPEATENGNSEEEQIPNNQEQSAVERSTGNGDGTVLPTIDQEYFTNFRQFCVLIAVANRLRVHDFVDAAVRFVAEWKHGKSLDDVRELLEHGASQVRAQQEAATSSPEKAEG